MTATALVEEQVDTSPPEPGSPAWLAARRRGIGASEIPAIMGLDRYKSGLDIWLEKRGMAEGHTDSPQARVGRFAEPMIASMYAAQTGSLISEVAKAAHPELPILSASADRMVLDAQRTPLHLLEIKNRGGLPQGWGEEGTDLVPEAVAIQVHVQLACYAMERADVAALLGGNDFRVYTLHRDAAIEAAVLEFTRTWWQRHMVEGIEPPLEGPNVGDYLARKFRTHTDEVVRVLPSDMIALWLETLATAQATQKDAKAEYDRAANEVKNFLGDRYAVEGPAGRAIWTLSKDGTKTDQQQVIKRLEEVLAEAIGREPAQFVRYDAERTATTVKPGVRSFRFTAKGGR